jgi:hypothetical protein
MTLTYDICNIGAQDRVFADKTFQHSLYLEPNASAEGYRMMQHDATGKCEGVSQRSFIMLYQWQKH